MADDEQEQKVPSKEQLSTGFHPGFGCAIGVAAVIVFGGLAAWGVYALISQNKMLAEISVDVNVPTEITEVTEEESEQMIERFAAYGEDAKYDLEASLRLTVDDLNVMVASLPALADYRGMVHFKEITKEEEIIADISLPMNQLGKKDHRYLLGEGTFVFKREDNNIHLFFDSVRIEGKEVPDGFQQNLKHLLWLLPFQKDEDLADIFINSAGILFEEGAVTISTEPTPGPKPGSGGTVPVAPQP